MPMVAGFPMYDWPELRDAHNSWWDGLRPHFTDIGLSMPQVIRRFDDPNLLWLNKNLMLAQTCGYPFATGLAGKVSYVCTPCYQADGCEGGYYSSAIIMGKEGSSGAFENAGQKFAYNGKNSQSGYQCMFEYVGDPETYYSETVCSGAHRKSAAMVAHGEADVAAIDAVCLAHMERFDPAIFAKLKVVSWTSPKPALPFITRVDCPSEDIETMVSALTKFVATEEGRILSSPLLIGAFERLDVAQYHAMAVSS